MVTITIETENEAFSEYPGIEIARILRKLANTLSDCADKRSSIRLLNCGISTETVLEFIWRPSMKTDFKIGDRLWVVCAGTKFPEIKSCVVIGFARDAIHLHCDTHNSDFWQFPESCYRTAHAAAHCKLSLLIDEQRSLCKEISKTLTEISKTLKEIKDV